MSDDDWGMEFGGGATIHAPSFNGAGFDLFNTVDTVVNRVAGTATNLLTLRTNYDLLRLTAEARIAEARARLASVPMSTWLMVGIAAVGLYFTAKAAK